MLQNLLEKINMNGLYYHKPERKYSRHDDLYWCQNWTFKPYVYSNKLYMRDTYWGYGDDLVIEVTENNINEFKLLFDFKNVKEVKVNNIWEFGEENKDWWVLSTDSGGIYHPKQYIRIGATRNKEMVINRKKEEIKDLQRQINNIESEIELIESGEIEIRDWM